MAAIVNLRPMRLAEPEASSMDSAGVGRAVLLWPALGAPARAYDAVSERIATAAGCPVYVAELRGQGEDAGSRASRQRDFGLRELVSDAAANVREIRTRAGEKVSVHHIGHSFGGVAAMHFAGVHGEDSAASVTTVGSAFARPGAYGWRAPFIAAAAASGYMLTEALGYFPGDVLQFAGRQPRTLARQWLGPIWLGEPDARGLPGVRAAIATLPMPTHVVGIEGDTISPPAAVDALAERVGGVPALRSQVSAGSGAGIRTVSGRNPHLSWLRDTPPDLLRAVVRLARSTADVEA